MSQSLDTLDYRLKPLCQAFLDQCRAAGLNIRLTFTYRTPQEQDSIYADGRSKPGPIRTNLNGTQSKHCITITDGTPASQAFDFMLFTNNWFPIKDGADPAYTKAGEIARGIPLKWGGDFHHPDYDHCELVL